MKGTHFEQRSPYPIDPRDFIANNNGKLKGDLFLTMMGFAYEYLQAATTRPDILTFKVILAPGITGEYVRPFFSKTHPKAEIAAVVTKEEAKNILIVKTATAGLVATQDKHVNKRARPTERMQAFCKAMNEFLKFNFRTMTAAQFEVPLPAVETN